MENKLGLYAYLSNLLSFCNMDKNFRKRLRYARQLRGLTLEELGKRLRVSYQSVQQWEAGDTTPRPKRLEALARELNVESRWLAYGGSESLPNGLQVAAVSATPAKHADLPFATRQLVRLLESEEGQQLPQELIEKTFEHFTAVIAGRAVPDI